MSNYICGCISHLRTALGDLLHQINTVVTQMHKLLKSDSKSVNTDAQTAQVRQQISRHPRKVLLPVTQPTTSEQASPDVTVSSA